MRDQRVLILLMIVLQVALLGYFTQAWTLPLVLLALTFVGLRFKGKTGWPLLQRPLFVWLTATVFLAKYLVAPYDVPYSRAFIRTPLAMEVAGFLISLEIVQLIGHSGKSKLPAWLPVLGLAALTFLLDIHVTFEERNIILALVLTNVLLIAGYFMAGRRTLDERPPALKGLWAMYLLASLAVFAIGATSARALYTHERALENWLIRLIGDRGHVATTGFSASGSLGDISRWRLTGSDRIALTISSREMPGYLRGKVFDRFNGEVWANTTEARPRAPVEPPAGLPPHESGSFLFSLDREPAGRWSRFEMHAEPDSGGGYFLPPGTRFLAADVPTLSVDEQGMPLSESDESPQPFTTFAKTAAPQQVPAPELLARYRSLSNETPGIVFQLADRLIDPENSVAEQARSVSRYFHKNYDYVLGMTVPRFRDPIEYFLADRPGAHCEYFASATVLLLRAAGIPARYVTGYVANERNVYGKFWVARHRDAHAWAEAWDESRQRWLIVESTPADGQPSPVADSRRQLAEAAWHQVERVRAAFRDGGLRSLFGDRLAFLLQPRFLLFFGTLGLALGWALSHWQRFRRRMSASLYDGYQGELQRVERRLTRRNLRRGPSESIDHFAERVALSGDGAAWALASSNWLRLYSRLRYGNPPSADALSALQQSRRSLRASFRTRPAR